ncbi:MAG: VOC family protein [Kiritimatiellae bacterium]|jgi:glyoxylase I family protein|nr:VOC family protein [Kiritimatiellia bacterium]
MPKTTGFHHTAIKVVDFDLCLAFYAQLGIHTARSWGEAPKRAAMLDVGDGNYLEVFEGGDANAPAEGRIIHFALRTDDCDGMHATALAAGATERMAPKDVEINSHQGPVPVRISFVNCPCGEILEFFQNRIL